MHSGGEHRLDDGVDAIEVHVVGLVERCDEGNENPGEIHRRCLPLSARDGSGFRSDDAGDGVLEGPEHDGSDDLNRDATVAVENHRYR